MRTVEINGREYPFHVSAAAAKLLTQMIADRSEATAKENYDDKSQQWKEGAQSIVAFEMVKTTIDLNIETLYLGMKHARMALPWYKVIWYNLIRPIPNRKRLEIMLPKDELEKIVGAEAIPEAAEDEKEGEETKKKH